MAKKRTPLLSLVIPVFKQEKTIQKDLRRIKNVMEKLPYSYEVLVVIDGEVDRTLKEAKKVRSKKIKVFSYKHNHGKGFAVRFGTAKSKGAIVGFLDAGMDLHPNGVSMLLEHFKWYNAHIIVGSKLHPVSKVDYPFSRKILSRGYRILVKLLFGLSIRDTQVGIKFFQRKVLEDILPRLLVKKYAFDIEMLSVAYYLGYRRIYEAPVELNFKNVSTITSKSFWRIVFFMLWDTCAVFYRLKILHYYDSKNKKKWIYDPELQLRLNII